MSKNAGSRLRLTLHGIGALVQDGTLRKRVADMEPGMASAKRVLASADAEYVEFFNGIIVASDRRQCGGYLNR